MRRSRFSRSLALLLQERRASGPHTHGLACPVVERASRRTRRRDSARHQPPARALADVLAAAMEVSDRVARLAAARATADGARFLSAARAWIAEPDRPVVD